MNFLFRVFLQGDGSALASVVSYAAFSRWQREVLQLAPFKNQIEYWQNQLKGIEPMLLPSDRPRPAMQVNIDSWIINYNTFAYHVVQT